MYTFLGCGVSYELFVVMLMLKLKIGKNQRGIESPHNTFYNYENIKRWFVLSMLVFMVLLVLFYLSELIAYWNCRINQLNRIAILVLYILTGLI